ncbi:MAG: hypothetical protein ACJAUA_000465 [Zhongshania aliphaticivorans]|jgi:hypothetical protein
MKYLRGKRGEVSIGIEESAGIFESLSCCNGEGSVNLYDYSAKRTWRHLNIFELFYKYYRAVIKYLI